MTQPAATAEHARPAAPATYTRFRIATRETADIGKVPPRFLVKVGKVGLAKLIVKELFHYRNLKVVASRPCMYGVFSGPVGGFAPRPQLCVGCLRCTTQYPEFVDVLPNPERAELGDSFFTPAMVEAIWYEARTGAVPVRGAGYRGMFGGTGWDGMWTDMSEIVRPTRDGIHGREWISTACDLGRRAPFLTFDASGEIGTPVAPLVTTQVPVLFDAPPGQIGGKRAALFPRILARAAHETGTLAMLPVDAILRDALSGPHVVPIVEPSRIDALGQLASPPQLVELASWDRAAFDEVTRRHPDAVIAARFALGSPDTLASVMDALDAGLGVMHLVADLHGRGADGRFMLEMLRDVHAALVGAARREEVTIIATGGIAAAEHVPKAIICGADVVAIETPLLAALQAHFAGECRDRNASAFQLPRQLTEEWAVQRVQNLMCSWRDQMLEILGAMGMREVRRLRGEIGRAMFQNELEEQAFGGIRGYG